MTLDEFRNYVTQQRNAQTQTAINAINAIAKSTINNNNVTTTEGNN